MKQNVIHFDRPETWTAEYKKKSKLQDLQISKGEADLESRPNKQFLVHNLYIRNQTEAERLYVWANQAERLAKLK
jgi:hypothetical protein